MNRATGKELQEVSASQTLESGVGSQLETRPKNKLETTATNWKLGFPPTGN